MHACMHVCMHLSIYVFLIIFSLMLMRITLFDLSIPFVLSFYNRAGQVLPFSKEQALHQVQILPRCPRYVHRYMHTYIHTYIHAYLLNLSLFKLSIYTYVFVFRTMGKVIYIYILDGKIVDLMLLLNFRF